MLIVEDHTVTVKRKAVIKAQCKLDSLSRSFTSIFLLMNTSCGEPIY